MRRHPLLIYERISRRIRGWFFWPALLLLAVAVYDQFEPLVDDDYWFVLWAAPAVLLLIWSYYKFIVPRAAIIVRPQNLRLQGPLFGANISYGRVQAAVSSQMAQHYPFEQLKGRERSLLEPLYNRPCLFIELKSYPPTFKRRRFWFPHFLFGVSRPGLICVVEDWLALSRDVEAARGQRQRQHVARRFGDARSMAARILDDADET